MPCSLLYFFLTFDGLEANEVSHAGHYGPKRLTLMSCFENDGDQYHHSNMCYNNNNECGTELY